MHTLWWNWAGWPSPEEWSAWWAFLTFFVTGGAAVAALIQLRAYITEREERARPFVIADYAFRSVLLSVAVTNSSGALATNIRISVEPPFQSSMSDRAAALNKVADPGYTIKQLAPGRTIQWTLDRTPDYFADKDLPRTYTVTVTYADPRAVRQKAWWKFWLPKLPAEYSDSFLLDIDQWSEASADTDYDNKNWNAFERIDKSVKRIADKAEEAVNRLSADTAQIVSGVDHRDDES